MSRGQYDKWYHKPFWKRRRRYQLACKPLCEMCERAGYITPATIADHNPPHNGDYNIFCRGALQSLCKPCHDGVKRRLDIIGYDHAVGVDGWPLDPMHPTYQPRQLQIEKYSTAKLLPAGSLRMLRVENSSTKRRKKSGGK